MIKKKRKKFQKNPCKQYKKIIRIYPSFLYNRLDKWLKTMSLNGWHIVDCGLLFFMFEKGELKEKEYFTCIPDVKEGKYSVGMRHPFFENKYGVKKKKSKINLNESKAYNILEIDTDKIDIKNDIGYRELINDRNSLHLRYFIRNSSSILIFVVAYILVRTFF